MHATLLGLSAQNLQEADAERDLGWNWRMRKRIRWPCDLAMAPARAALELQEMLEINLVQCQLNFFLVQSHRARENNNNPCYEPTLDLAAGLAVGYQNKPFGVFSAIREAHYQGHIAVTEHSHSRHRQSSDPGNLLIPCHHWARLKHIP